jgi:hypothetical protein
MALLIVLVGLVLLVHAILGWGTFFLNRIESARREKETNEQTRIFVGGAEENSSLSGPLDQADRQLIGRIFGNLKDIEHLLREEEEELTRLRRQREAEEEKIRLEVICRREEAEELVRLENRRREEQEQSLFLLEDHESRQRREHDRAMAAAREQQEKKEVHLEHFDLAWFLRRRDEEKEEEEEQQNLPEDFERSDERSEQMRRETDLLLSAFQEIALDEPTPIIIDQRPISRARDPEEREQKNLPEESEVLEVLELSEEEQERKRRETALLLSAFQEIALDEPTPILVDQPPAGHEELAEEIEERPAVSLSPPNHNEIGPIEEQPREDNQPKPAGPAEESPAPLIEATEISPRPHAPRGPDEEENSSLVSQESFFRKLHRSIDLGKQRSFVPSPQSTMLSMSERKPSTAPARATDELVALFPGLRALPSSRVLPLQEDPSPNPNPNPPREDEEDPEERSRELLLAQEPEPEPFPFIEETKEMPAELLDEFPRPIDVQQQQPPILVEPEKLAEPQETPPNAKKDSPSRPRRTEVVKKKHKVRQQRKQKQLETFTSSIRGLLDENRQLLQRQQQSRTLSSRLLAGDNDNDDGDDNHHDGNGKNDNEDNEAELDDDIVSARYRLSPGALKK